ncbi:MAG: hypothetical protein AB7G75_24615 [Candidatus Binatia bacterium]
MTRFSLYILTALLVFPYVVQAQPEVIIESPQEGENVSGIYVLRFIDCNGIITSFSLDDSPATLQFATGLSRGDAASFCGGDPNVGGAVLFNWGLASAGAHTIHFRDAANNIVTSRNVNVVNFGEEFKTTFNPLALIMQNQPMDGMTTELRFSIPAQGYQANAIRQNDEPNPSQDDLISLFQNRPTTLTITNPDRSVETHTYLFTRVITYTNGIPGIVDDTPDTNSAVLATAITGPFGDGIIWRPPYPYNLLDFDNCLYASLDEPTQTITQTTVTGSLLRGVRDDAGACITFPFLNVIDAKQVQGTIAGN